MLIVICYDIADTRRRLRVSKTLLSYGERVQESVYEVEVDATQWKRLYARVQELIAAEDRLCCYLLCENCRTRIRVDGAQPTTQRPARCIVV
jgi:CRISPR-associated protein Cas2